MKFEWDTHKNQMNKAKHKIGFALAVRVFTDPFRIDVYDADHSHEEDRWKTIGIIDRGNAGLMLVVIYTERKATELVNNTIRIISARKANEQEKKLYHNI